MSDKFSTAYQRKHTLECERDERETESEEYSVWGHPDYCRITLVRKPDGFSATGYDEYENEEELDFIQASTIQEAVAKIL